MDYKIAKLSKRQVECVEYLKKNGEAWHSFNNYFHESTVKSLIKKGICEMRGRLLVLKTLPNNENK